MLLDGLERKYGESFQIVSDAKLGDQQHVWFTATVAPVDQLAHVAQAAVRMDGNAKDDFARWLYWDEITAPVIKVLESKDYLESYEVEVHVPETSQRWGRSNTGGTVH